ncbi:MAG: hypothetical protein U0V74_09340 [Chitinophagales bacterium]
MKKLMLLTGAFLLCSFIYAQPQFFLGLRPGAGAMLTNNQLRSFSTTEGTRDILGNRTNWSFVGKGEALLGLGRFRFGYRFLYNYSKNRGQETFYPLIDNTIDYDRMTAYFNKSSVHTFGHYGVLEIAIINTRHFALTPGLALGGYMGYVKDANGNKVRFSDIVKYRFTVGAELNAEIKLNRVTILFGPNYYMFNRQDKFNADWKQYAHLIGGDVGLRVNLIKPK